MNDETVMRDLGREFLKMFVSFETWVYAPVLKRAKFDEVSSVSLVWALAPLC